MSFPVPPDVRGTRDFELVLGMDEMLRQTMPIFDLTEAIDAGEWLKPDTSNGVTKARKLEVADDISTPARGCKVSWTDYRQNDSNNGQSDALATGTLDLLSGTYQAKTKLYNTGSGNLAPGNLLLPVYDAVLGGILDAPVPAAITIVQLQSVVGRVIEVANGQLHYEAPGL